MNDLRTKLLNAFQVEHRDYLAGIRGFLARTAKSAEPVTAAEIEEVFRQAHSLRAAARVCDLSTVEKIGQRLETLFSQVRKGTLRLTPEIHLDVHSVLTAVEDWVRVFATDPATPEPTAALATLDRVLGEKPQKAAPVENDELTPRLMAAFQVEHKEHLEGIRGLLAAFDTEAGITRSGIDEAFRRAHSLKGAARLADLRIAESLANRLETLFAHVREGKVQLNHDIVRAIKMGLDTIEDCAACRLENKPFPDSSAALDVMDRCLGSTASEADPIVETPHEPDTSRAAFQPVTTVRVNADNLDRLLRSAGQLLGENLRQNMVTRELTDLTRQLAALEREWETVRRAAANELRQDAGGEAGRLGHFVELVENQLRELTRHSRQVKHLQQSSAWSLGLLAGQLQLDVRQARMVSAESVFVGFRKMMRDLARDEGKEIDFHVTGLEIEADRMVLQTLKDPLMHILRNAVSHGIEPPAERRSADKSEEGHVALQFGAVGNRLRITVDDDGRGIDPRRIAEVALRRGLLGPNELAALSETDVARLIFQPGFTTTRMVTGLSGRGMGLSVAFEAVGRLQGEIDLQTKEGPGTRLVVSVPLSISTQRLLLVRCQGQTFAVPVHALERLLRIKLGEVETVEGKPMLLVQNQPIPLLSLAHLLRMENPNVCLAEDRLHVMLVRSGSRRVAIAVDSFLAERDGLIKDLDAPAAQVALFAGGILLEDGSIALVLNPTEIMKSFKPADRAPPLRTTKAAPEKKAATVLVVDDSLTTRTLEKSLLEAHGYRVRLAMDGTEALAQLQSELPDLVITDIQMPRMDGFQLLEEIRKDRRLAQLPVIVVTSMERREDQERGLALGADAYIVKRKFDHQELLDTIRQII